MVDSSSPPTQQEGQRGKNEVAKREQHREDVRLPGQLGGLGGNGGPPAVMLTVSDITTFSLHGETPCYTKSGGSLRLALVVSPLNDRLGTCSAISWTARELAPVGQLDHQYESELKERIQALEGQKPSLPAQGTRAEAQILAPPR